MFLQPSSNSPSSLLTSESLSGLESVSNSEHDFEPVDAYQRRPSGGNTELLEGHDKITIPPIPSPLATSRSSTPRLARPAPTLSPANRSVANVETTTRRLLPGKRAASLENPDSNPSTSPSPSNASYYEPVLSHLREVRYLSDRLVPEALDCVTQWNNVRPQIPSL